MKLLLEPLAGCHRGAPGGRVGVRGKGGEKPGLSAIFCLLHFRLLSTGSLLTVGGEKQFRYQPFALQDYYHIQDFYHSYIIESYTSLI
jgi:hypothetical protein